LFQGAWTLSISSKIQKEHDTEANLGWVDDGDCADAHLVAGGYLPETDPK
jgi:hypothetical protein